MNPKDAADSIEQCKKLVSKISTDPSMSTIFSSMFDMLQNLCINQLTAENFAMELEQMEVDRSVAMRRDVKRCASHRKLIYALSQSIQYTAAALVYKSSEPVLEPEPFFNNDFEIKQDPEVISCETIRVGPADYSVPDNEKKKLRREVKIEPVDDDEMFFHNPVNTVKDPVVPKVEEPDDFTAFLAEEQTPSTSQSVKKKAAPIKLVKITAKQKNDLEHSINKTETGSFICPFCKNQRTERSLRSLQTHMRIHHGAKTVSLKTKVPLIMI